MKGFPFENKKCIKALSNKGKYLSIDLLLIPGSYEYFEVNFLCLITCRKKK